ncbi:hypothetical protein SPFL3102_01494 [Sporomusaceae bacterium FL31]|nr:hypothetical protein SPFL3101_03127 [Sporomusaceae bacterium FL31]GCE33686.1 hypothetical protein SPFL3102_01494 [Sporomusaceae bacterium]
MAGGKGDYCSRVCQPHFDQARTAKPCREGKYCENQQPVLMDENIETWRLWEAICTQWRSSPTGGPVGLDYPAMFCVAGVFGIEITPAVLIKIQALEANVILKRNEEIGKGG